MLLSPWLFLKNVLLILSTRQKGIKFHGGPFTVRINLLILAVKSFGIVVIVGFMMFAKYCTIFMWKS